MLSHLIRGAVASVFVMQTCFLCATAILVFVILISQQHVIIRVCGFSPFNEHYLVFVVVVLFRRYLHFRLLAVQSSRYFFVARKVIGLLHHQQAPSSDCCFVER
jgi:hypothetical protein